MHQTASSPIRIPVRRRAPMVLVVANDVQIREEMCRLLRLDGYEPVPVRQGIEAYWCLERHAHRLALLVTDLLPPVPDGYHMGIPYGKLRPNLPVLFVNAGRRETHIRRGLLHPKARFLQRPFAPTVFRRTVRDVIASWPAPPAA